MNGGKENSKGVWTYADGGRYEGGFVEGKRTGKGVFINRDGKRYEVEYEDGHLNFI